MRSKSDMREKMREDGKEKNFSEYEKNMDEIIVKGAKENNLKNIDVRIPRNTLTVFTGLSGSGKSTLAFDTIFAEGQAAVRRKPVLLRAAVSGTDGKAGRGEHRRAFPRHLHRPEDDFPITPVPPWAR